MQLLLLFLRGYDVIWLFPGMSFPSSFLGRNVVFCTLFLDRKLRHRNAEVKCITDVKLSFPRHSVGVCEPNNVLLTGL